MYCRHALHSYPTKIMLLKFLSWNVNGIRAISKKPEWRWLRENDAQIIALQETKANPKQLSEEIRAWSERESFWDYSIVKKGYSGVSVFSSLKPIQVTSQLPDARFQGEGRLLHLEFEAFHFFNGYFPNGGAPELDEDGIAKPGKFKRVPYKLGFLECFLKLAVECKKTKPVIICGDFNIAAEPIDLAHPEENSAITGFLPEERAWMRAFLQNGFVDSFRHVHGAIPGQYTWWSYQHFGRQRNNGWRLDYFFVSDDAAQYIREAEIFKDIKGSDHCPVGLVMEMPGR